MLAFLPVTPDFDVGTLYCRPGDAMGGFFLTILARMCRKGVIKGFPVNVLRVRWQA